MYCLSRLACLFHSSVKYLKPLLFHFSADGTLICQSNLADAKNGPMSHRGKKKEISLDDVGGAVFRASSALGSTGGAKGKRSDRDPSSKNGKAGRLPTGGNKGERRTKSKPKQRTAQLSMSGVNFTDRVDSIHPPERKDVRFLSSGNAPSNDKKESLDFSTLPLAIDGIDDLGVDTEMGAPQDLNSWFNFEVEDGHEAIGGLEIPMDDLTELMF